MCLRLCMSQFQDDKINQISLWLKENIQLTKLYLYGSRANGTASEESDYDFVALVPDFRGKPRF